MAKPAVVDVEGEKGNFGDPHPFDPTFKGPIKNRSCTDILCLFLFIAFIAGWVVVAIFAFKMGNPEMLLHPTDSNGSICGTGYNADKPFLVFFDITQCARASALLSGCNTPQVCVEKCPTSSFSYFLSSKLPSMNIKDLRSKLICQNGVNTEQGIDQLNQLVREDKCAAYYLDSSSVGGRCVPNFFKDLPTNFTSKDNTNVDLSEDNLKKAAVKMANILDARNVSERIFQDFSQAWWLMIVFLLFSMVISFVWILLMRWISGVMVVLSIIFVVVLLGFASGFSFYTYYQLDQNKEVDAFKIELVRNLKTFTASKRTWLATGIIFGVIWLILVLMLIFLRKRINLAIALISEGSKAVGSSISSLFFPLFPYLLKLLIFAFWGAIAVYIASSGKRTFQLEAVNGTELGDIANKSCDENTMETSFTRCVFNKYEGEGNLFRAQIYNLFGLFWCLFFIVGFGQMSLAGAFASYYWAFNKPKDIPYFAVAGGMWRSFRFHLGSIAFGSLLIAIIRMIRVILDYIDQKCKKYENPFTKCVICFCKCCFWCLEKFMRFLSKNAYIMIAVYGQNFCTAAKESFMLLMRNVVRVVVLDRVTDYLLLLGKLVIVGATAVLSFFFFKGDIPYLNEHSPELNYYFLPVITVTIGAYIIATGFFNVYSMAVDTLFLCFLEDCERNDGSPERPYYMSKELMKILGKKNKFRDQQ